MLSTMLSGRVNALAVLHEHKTFTDKWSLKELPTEFPSHNESRLSAFGTFV